MVLRRVSGARDTAGLQRRTMGLAVAVVAGLAACSTPPKSVSPVELYRSAAGFSLNDDTTGERNAQNLEAGSKEPYPNLGTVPPPPDRAMSSIDRQKLQQGLADDRMQAKQTDANLRGSGTASNAPTPITRPSSSAGGAAASDSKRNVDGALPGGHSNASGARRRTSPGSDQVPQETALSSPAVHAVPEGDTPRAAPPPPTLPPPEEPRKPVADQTAKPTQGATGKRPSQQAAAARPERPAPDAASPAPADAASTAKAGTAPPPAVAATPGASWPPPLGPSDTSTSPSEKTAAALPPRLAADAGSPSPTDTARTTPAPADEAMRIPPLPPADMMSPPGKAAGTAPVPPPADAASTAKAGTAPPPPAVAATPGASWAPPLGPSDTPKSPSEKTAAALPPRPAADAGSPPPTDTARTTPAPADEAMRIPPLPPADMMSPPGKAAGTAAVSPPADAASTAKAGTAPPPPPAVAATPGASWPPPLGPSDTPKSPSERTAALDVGHAPQQPPAVPPPAPAAAKAPEQQAALAPVPQAAPPTGKPGVVSLQAAEINFAANGLTLTPEDDRRLADVVKLYDKHGGIVRVVGYGRRGYGADAAQQELASFSKAIERANVVAKALAGLGLASNRIVVQAAPVGDGLGEDRAEVLLEF